VFLAIVQGLTEFLPVSSSGHLVLLQKLFNIENPPVFFDVLLHIGTLLAIIIFFKKQLFELIKYPKKNINLWIFVIVGSIPAGIVGYLLKEKIDSIFSSLFLLGISWIVFGIFSIISSMKIDEISKKRDSLTIQAKDGLFIGFFQAIALFPGVSRSGSTVITGLLSGFSNNTAVFLSFLLAIPAILGASVFEAGRGMGSAGLSLPAITASVLLSFLIGYFSLILLEMILKENKFRYFGYYCLLAGIFSILVSLV